MVTVSRSNVLPPGHLLGQFAVIRAALDGLGSYRTDRFLAELRTLAEQEPAIALRLAMVLACVKQHDVSKLGYSGFLAFCRERVDWRQAWMRALVRLVESPLELVKAAAASGQLPLRIAVQAPGKVSVEQQAAWIDEAVSSGAAPDMASFSRAARPRSTFHDQDAEDIAKGRALARACMGRPAPMTEVDGYILRHWREGVPGKALQEGRTPPPVPEPLPIEFEWATPSGPQAGDAPGQALFGPWRPPATLDEALEQLESVQAVLRGRQALLARAFALLHHHAGWIDAGFETPWEFAEQVLGWSKRTAQRHRKLGWALDWFPQLDESVRQGFSLDSACDIGWICSTDAECNRMLELARHLGQQDSVRALSKWGARSDEYQRALAIARRHATALLGPDGPTAQPSGTVAVFWFDGPEEGGVPSAGTPAHEAGAGEGATGAGSPEVVLRVALPPSEPERFRSLRAHPHLAEAARWFLANNQPRTPSGFAAVKRLVWYRCENPECGCIMLRVEAHHIHWRRHGGADDPSNAVVLCPRCHLRGVHTADERIRVSRVVIEGLEARLWEYPRRPPILQFLELPP